MIPLNSLYPLLFQLFLQDEVTPAIGMKPTIQLLRGVTFSKANGTVRESGQGWYCVTLNSTDTSVFGDMAILPSCVGCAPVPPTIMQVT